MRRMRLNRSVSSRHAYGICRQGEENYLLLRGGKLLILIGLWGLLLCWYCAAWSHPLIAHAVTNHLRGVRHWLPSSLVLLSIFLRTRRGFGLVIGSFVVLCSPLSCGGGSNPQTRLRFNPAAYLLPAILPCAVMPRLESIGSWCAPLPIHFLKTTRLSCLCQTLFYSCYL